MDAPQPKILIIEDDPQIRKFLVITLTEHQFTAIPAVRGHEGIRLATSFKPDAILLDLGLPDIDGKQVIQAVREWSKVPIIVLSVRAEEDEKVAAFDLGANDYVTKPFGAAELLARIRAALRYAIVCEAKDVVVKVGDLRIDLERRLVTLRGNRIKLSPKEYKLLQLLAIHSGKLLTHRFLMQQMWGEAYGENNQYLRIYIAQLRQKLEQDPARDLFIVNEPGIGYRLEAPVST